VLTVTLGYEGTFPRPLPCVPSELLTDSLEMRTTASLIVTMFFGHKEARRQRRRGGGVRVVGVQLVGVLIPR
jgi:hypothetical protein